MKDFVHLHLHSDYSTLDGACQFDRLFDRMAEVGQTAVALTDHGFMGGVMDFQSAAKRKGIKPIIGCEIYLTLGSNREKGDETYHMGLICRNMEGNRNLTKLVSDAHVNGFYRKPRADLTTLAKHAGGLMGFTGCLAGVVPQMLIRGEYDKAREMTAKFVDIFGQENYFVELQNHGIPEQSQIAKDLLRLAKEFDLRPVATNDVHYVKAEDAGPHDALLCIGTGKNLSDEKRLKYSENAFYLRSGEEMAALFPEVPEALANTKIVGEMSDLHVKTGGNHYPVYSLPKDYAGSAADYLRELCTTGLADRYQVDAPTARMSAAPRDREIMTRLDYELSIIAKTGFSDYFLVVWDFIDWAKKRGISVGAGRGSGAGSLVAYILKITDIDPLRYGLLFERFLNPERVSPPDFDIDFCMRRRGEVVEYVREKYGRDCVANIITFGTLGVRSLMRDLARVHGHPYSVGDRLAKMVPDEPNVTLKSALHRSADLKEAAKDPLTAKILAEAEVLEGMVRNTGKHAAGIVITPSPVSDFVPLTLQDGDVTTQFSMEWVEKLGLLKMDFLGLRTLTVIADAEDHIRRLQPAFKIEDIPLDDAKTFALLNRGDSTGVFQMESDGIRSLARQLEISAIEEIIALVALYRPGPMDLIPDYIRGKKDPSTVKYPHPLLENVCRETYGIMVYQEQVMEAARIIGGYTLGGADVLRRAMGKKQKDEMEKQRSLFIEGAARTNQIDAGTAGSIFALLEKFAGYGFNKSHSAAYGLITYRTAWLKANYPVQFMAAMLTSVLGAADKMAGFVEEASRMGIKVLGPDINESLAGFTPIPEKNSIRFGLAGVKGVGEVAAEAILQARERHGPTKSLDHFLGYGDGRIANRRVIEALVKTGAFDALHPKRAALFDRLDAAIGAASSKAAEVAAGQDSFMDLLGEESAPRSIVTDTTGREFTAMEILDFERELLGYYISGHPMDQYGPMDKVIDTYTVSQLRESADRTEFRLCGVVLAVERKISRKDNQPWAVFSVATQDGNIDVSLFSNAYPSYCQHLSPGNALVIMGSTLRNDDGVRLAAKEVYLLENSLPALVMSIRWGLRADHPELPDFLHKLRKAIDVSVSGQTRMEFDLYVDDGTAAAAVAAQSLVWRFYLPVFRELRAHPAVLSADFEIKPPRLRPRTFSRNVAA